MVSQLVVFLYVLVVYSTIPFAPYFVDFLRKIFGEQYGIFISSSIILFMLFILIKVREYLINRRTIFWFSFLFFSGVFVVFTMEIPAERIHFIEYGFLAYLLILATGENKILAFLLGSVFGTIDELIQLFFQYQKIFPLPRRYFEWKDIGMNIFGVFLGCVFYRYIIEEGRKAKADREK